jgi:hypothetical protein
MSKESSDLLTDQPEPNHFRPDLLNVYASVVWRTAVDVMAVIRRVIVAFLLLVSLLGATPSGPLPAAAQSCDPAYPDVCVPPVEEVGDLDCPDIG